MVLQQLIVMIFIRVGMVISMVKVLKLGYSWLFILCMLLMVFGVGNVEVRNVFSDISQSVELVVFRQVQKIILWVGVLCGRQWEQLEMQIVQLIWQLVVVDSWIRNVFQENVGVLFSVVFVLRLCSVLMVRMLNIVIIMQVSQCCMVCSRLWLMMVSNIVMLISRMYQGVWCFGSMVLIVLVVRIMLNMLKLIQMKIIVVNGMMVLCRLNWVCDWIICGKFMCGFWLVWKVMKKVLKQMLRMIVRIEYSVFRLRVGLVKLVIMVVSMKLLVNQNGVWCQILL